MGAAIRLLQFMATLVLTPAVFCVSSLPPPPRRVATVTVQPRRTNEHTVQTDSDLTGSRWALADARLYAVRIPPS